MLDVILSLFVSGLIIGLLARFAVPGKDPLKLWQTLALGILGSFVGQTVALLVGAVNTDGVTTGDEAFSSFAFSLGGAIVLLILYRKYVQKRPLTGPGSR